MERYTISYRELQVLTVSNMKKAIIIIGLVIGLCAGDAIAVELKDTPIQTQMFAGLAVPVAQENAFYNASGGKLFGSSRDSDNKRTERKSVGKAILYSILLPGLGERYVGHKKKASYFFAAEALWWVGYISYHTYGGWKEDAYINFARERADADLEGKSEEFLDFVGYYYSIDQYNTVGRVLDRNRPYLEDNASNHWRWYNSSDKAAFREMKNSSREAFRRADFMIGLMVLSRIVSAIDAAHDARVSRRLFGASDSPGKSPVLGYRLHIDPFGDSRYQLGLTMYKRF